MPSRKKPIDYNELARDCLGAIKEIGADAAVFLLVAIGVVVGFWKKAPAHWVFGTACVIIGGWLVNKLVSAYLRWRQEDLELQKLKLTEGVKLLELHKDRQRALPLARKGRNGPNGDDNEPDANH